MWSPAPHCLRLRAGQLQIVGQLATSCSVLLQVHVTGVLVPTLLAAEAAVLWTYEKREDKMTISSITTAPAMYVL